MFEIIAQGPQPRQRLRIRLEAGRAYVVGRHTAADLPVLWEPHLSGRHVELRSQGGALRLERVPASRNPVHVEGRPVQSVELRAGDRFVIGETAFQVAEASLEPSPEHLAPLQEFSFSRQQLLQVRFADADRRLEVLARLSDVIGSTRDMDERDSRLVNLLLAGLQYADVVAVVESTDEGEIVLGSWERRLETAGAFRPSSRLATEALRRGSGTLLHLWTGHQASQPEYTQAAEVDWAFCTPVGQREDRRWGLYVSGRLDREGSGANGSSVGPRMQADVKFTELVADLINSVIRLGNLEAHVAVLRQFLSPPIVAALERSSEAGTLDASLLEPRECDVTVLFCDLRGFSQRAEEQAHDLHGLLRRVSGALEIMTGRVTEYGGVTGDFLGDATLGFWGWPFASEEAPLNACRAALAIRRAFEELRANSRHPLHDFEVGVGLAHGRAVAGKIGTQDRMTVSVFGPVVNLASRLESLTRQLRVPILLDEATATIVRERLATSEGRTRRLARLLPFGLETPLTVSELLPSVAELPALTDEHLERYERGFNEFQAGRWEQAHAHLHGLPAHDRAPDFLMLRITQANRSAPAGWDGVIRVPGK
jgi:adenylate cyclase